jgi:hypothetical protein
LEEIKLSARFLRDLLKYVEEYIYTCPTCQMRNDAKFQKAPAPLHPIAGNDPFLAALSNQR